MLSIESHPDVCSSSCLNPSGINQSYLCENDLMIWFEWQSLCHRLWFADDNRSCHTLRQVSDLKEIINELQRRRRCSSGAAPSGVTRAENVDSDDLMKLFGCRRSSVYTHTFLAGLRPGVCTAGCDLISLWFLALWSWFKFNLESLKPNLQKCSLATVGSWLRRFRGNIKHEAIFKIKGIFLD